MPEKTEKKITQPEQRKPIMFKCQFCGEEKPLADLVMMRQYYPLMAACKSCSNGPKVDVSNISES
jgi:transcription elongation factor Elf1